MIEAIWVSKKDDLGRLQKMKVMQEYLIKKVITSVNKELVYSSLTFNRCYYLLSYTFLKNNLFELWYTALCEKYI